MASFTRGTSFVDGVAGDVTAAKLHALVDAATPVPGFITDRTAETSIADDDLVLISDTSESGALNKMTVSNLMKAAMTGTINSTAGTITTLNSTTGTITTGVIPTLTSTTLITSGTGTASTPAIVPTGDTNTGIFFPAADTIAFSKGGTEAMRIDSSGNVGIGGSPSTLLNIIKDDRANGAVLRLTNSAESSSWVSGDIIGDIDFFSSDSSGSGVRGRIRSVSEGGATNPNSVAMSFWTYSGGNVSERLRITSDGSVLVGKTQTSGTVVGVFINTNGKGSFTSDADAPLAINRLTNDGGLVEFFQASTLEGTISVSGTTVSYNGGHLSRYSQLQSGQRDLSIKKGTILSNLDEMCVWNDAEGNPLPNEQLNKVKISDVEGDSNVAGVFVNWDNDDQDNPFDLNMAMTGDMIIRIAQGVSVSRGDLLMSAGDGTAKPQGDDICKSKTIAKVTSANVTCTYEDGSYCVPCVLMAC